jgi:ABC-2 type transport system ATP-binding protein
MRQRLSIARGLINDPAYLLLDEPTLGLDAPIARDLRAVVSRLANDGVGVLLTSHYLAEVEQLCRHVYVISAGRLVAEGSPDHLKTLAESRHAVLVTLAADDPAVLAAVHDLAADTGAEVRHEVDGDGRLQITLRHHEDIAGALATTVVRAGGSIIRLEVTEPTLEDAIIALAEGELPSAVGAST